MQIQDWAGTAPPGLADAATAALEEGAVLFFPDLRFAVTFEETALFSPSIAAAKNVSFDPPIRQIDRLS